MNQPISEYVLFSSVSDLDLVERINQAIKDGWQPIGGIAISESEGFYQAMGR